MADKRPAMRWEGWWKEQAPDIFRRTFSAEAYVFRFFATEASDFYLFESHEEGPAVWLVQSSSGGYKVRFVEEEEKLSHRIVPGPVEFEHFRTVSDDWLLDNRQGRIERWLRDEAKAFSSAINTAFVELLMRAASATFDMNSRAPDLGAILADTADALRGDGFAPDTFLFPSGCLNRLVNQGIITRDYAIDSLHYAGKTVSDLHAFWSSQLDSDTSLVFDSSLCIVLVRDPKFFAGREGFRLGLRALQYVNPIVKDARAVVALERIEHVMSFANVARRLGPMDSADQPGTEEGMVQSVVSGKPSLVVPRVEARRRIQERIELGQALLSAPLGSEEALEDARLEMRKWSNYNWELLRRIADSDALWRSRTACPEFSAAL